jgi:hypothetical protein
MARYTRPVINFNADDVWAAAVAAQRINGVYHKTVPVDALTGAPIEGIRNNRQIVNSLLADPTIISQEDRDEGEKVRTYYKGLTFKILQGVMLNEFDNNAMTIANRDLIQSVYDVAVITSLPSCYQRAKERDDANAKLRDATGGYLSTVGSKVTIDMKVIKSNYSANYNTYFVSGLTTENQAVFFCYKNSMALGKIVKVSGNVKAHRDNSTQLNRVKVI